MVPTARLLLAVALCVYVAGQSCMPAGCTLTDNKVYVSPTGSGVAGTLTAPVSLATALSSFGVCATSTNQLTLRLMWGTYSITAPINIPSYVTIEGGFENVDGTTWKKTSDSAKRTIISRSSATIEDFSNQFQRIVAIYASSVTSWELRDIRIVIASGANGVNPGDPGTSVYGVLIRSSSNYNLVRVDIQTGTAGNGVGGSSGAPGGNGQNGAGGGGGNNNSGGGPGNGGAGGCGGGGCMAGGGSVGGCPAKAGKNGVDGWGRWGGGGGGGSSGGCCCGDGAASGGTGGAGSSGGAGGGSGGSGCDPGCGCQSGAGSTGGTGAHGGVFTAAAGSAGNGWTNADPTGYVKAGNRGASGTDGRGGSGGGGGGSSGYQDGCATDGSGHGGGGGGGGGEGGFGGTGGGSGGSSLAVHIYNNGAATAIQDSYFVVGNAGNGGLGAGGGAGGIGGTGGSGVGANSYLGSSGAGGSGGGGQQGGTGGNGQNGASMALSFGSGTGLTTTSYGFDFNSLTNLVEVSAIRTCTGSSFTFKSINAVAYSWDFGAGAQGCDTGVVASASTVTVKYTTTGRKNIIMNARTYRGVVNVDRNPAPPVIAVTGFPSDGTPITIHAGQTVTFSTPTISCTGSWSWNFNGLATGGTQLFATQSVGVTITTTLGTYTVSLQQTDSLCGVFSNTRMVTSIGTDTATATPTPSVTPTSSVTPSRTASVTPTSSVTPSITSSMSASVTSSMTPTISESGSITPTMSESGSITPTISTTSSATGSASESASRTASPSDSASVTSSISESSTATNSISISATGSISESASVTPSHSESSSRSPSISETSTASITQSVTPTISESSTVTPTMSESATISDSSSASATASVSGSATATVSTTMSLTAAASITATTSVSMLASAPTLKTPTTSARPNKVSPSPSSLGLSGLEASETVAVDSTATTSSPLAYALPIALIALAACLLVFFFIWRRNKRKTKPRKPSASGTKSNSQSSVAGGAKMSAVSVEDDGTVKGGLSVSADEEATDATATTDDDMDMATTVSEEQVKRDIFGKPVANRGAPAVPSTVDSSAVEATAQESSVVEDAPVLTVDGVKPASKV